MLKGDIISWQSPNKTTEGNRNKLTIECDLFVAQQVNEARKQFLLFIVLCFAILQSSHDISTGLCQENGQSDEV